MDIPVYRLIDLARLLFFRALLLEAERRRDVSPSTSAHDTLQTARTHRRRAARRGRGVRPTGTPLSARGVDSRQRAVDLRPMPDLCGQRARRGRLFAFDANGELIEAPTPAGDVPSARRTTRPSRGAVPCAERPMPSTAENVDASMRAVPFSERPVPSALLDPLFPEWPMPSTAGDVHAAVRDVLAPAEEVPSLERAARSSRRSVPSAKRSAPSLTEIVPLDLVDSPFPERSVRSAKRSVPSAKRSAPSLEEIVSSDLLDSPFPERPMPTAAGDVHSVKRSAPSLEEVVSSDLLDSPFPERAVRSAKRSVPSKTGTLHTRTADGVVAGEARYAALAKRSAETADRLLRRVSRHRAKGR